MRIAIIGAGNVGAALAQASIKAGHEVTISAAGAEHAEAVAKQSGATAAASNIEAVQAGDAIVLAVPHAATSAIADELAYALSGKIVIDATNPLNETFTGLVTEGGVSAAESLQERLPDANVVKAFNTIVAGRHSTPTQDGESLDAFIAGDDDEAKSKVADFASSLGYRVIDAGSLRMARSLEEMAFLNITLNASNGWPWQSAWKLVGPTQAV
ncbi:MAG: NADPH-dependent F420 reductase [Nocardioidaceae bacterium]|nr:NADPH-dependent F420 reductase [Nocardioidaceae bacterium]